MLGGLQNCRKVELILGLITCVHLMQGIQTILPRQNLWVTWANLMYQSPFCLPLATPRDPFQTCLIGVPYLRLTDWQKWVTNKTKLDSKIIIRTCNSW